MILNGELFKSTHYSIFQTKIKLTFDLENQSCTINLKQKNQKSNPKHLDTTNKQTNKALIPKF